jgi:hypothetical protein
MPKILKKKICDECEEEGETVKLTPALGVNLCSDCKELSKYTLICKSIAKKEYYLTEKELEEIESFTAQNPHYKSGSEMTLFRESDIQEAFCEKYNVEDIDGINDKKEELEEERKEKSIRIKAGKANKKINRRIELIEALDSFDLKLREDSKLCQGYIDGTITDWSIPQIVNRMCQMKYLYDYCDMDSAYEEARENQIEEFNAGYFPDCSLFDEAELIALKNKGHKECKYPNKWPWMK